MMDFEDYLTPYEDYYSWFTVRSPLPGTAPTTGAPGTINIPAKEIKLPGGITFTLKGGTWSIGGSGSPARDAVVSITNQFEQMFQANLEAWRTKRISAEEALEAFDTLWQEYVTALRRVGDANEINRALADRQRGGKFDWFAAYRDPIEGAGGGGTARGFTLPSGNLIDWLRNNLLWVLIIFAAVMVLRK